MTQMFEKGFSKYSQLLPHETVTEISEFLNSRLDSCLSRLMELLNCDDIEHLASRCSDYILNPQDSFEYNFETSQLICGHFDLETRLNEMLQNLYTDKNVIAAVSDLLEDKDICVHLPPVARFVLPRNQAAAVPAHQDFSYNSHLKNFVTMWTPMQKIDSECQGVIFYEGSQGKNFESENSDQRFWLQSLKNLEDYPKTTMEMTLGDALFLSPSIVHESGSNTSNRTRVSVDNRFFRRSEGSEKSYLDIGSGKIIHK